MGAVRPMDRLRPYKIITGVVREALRSSGRSGVVLSGGGPEQALLEEWFAKAEIPYLTPERSALGQARGLLNSIRHQAGEVIESKWPAITRAGMSLITGVFSISSAGSWIQS